MNCSWDKSLRPVPSCELLRGLVAGPLVFPTFTVPATVPIKQPDPASQYRMQVGNAISVYFKLSPSRELILGELKTYREKEPKQSISTWPITEDLVSICAEKAVATRTVATKAKRCQTLQSDRQP